MATCILVLAYLLACCTISLLLRLLCRAIAMPPEQHVPPSIDVPALRGVDAQNLAVQQVQLEFDTALLHRICAVFEQRDYLQRIQRLGIFHRMAALLSGSGLANLRLPAADHCGDPKNAIVFASRVALLHNSHYNEWLHAYRTGAVAASFDSVHPQLSRAYTLLMIAGNVARASTWQDWRVDREDDVLAERLGLQGSMLDVECALAEAYTRPGEQALHYIKGPGNGMTVARYDADASRFVTRGTEKLPLHSVVDHVRVGDRLYFEIEAILERYLRPELLEPRTDAAEEATRVRAYRHARQVVDILTHALQHQLRDAWAPRLAKSLPNRSASDGIAAAVPDFFDMNQIFLLLQRPDELFQGVVELGKALESREFIGDGAKRMSLSVRRWVAGYRNRSLSDADADAVEWRRFRGEHLLELYAQRVALEDILQELSHVSVHIPARFAELAALYTEYTGNELAADECTRQGLYERFAEYRSAVEDDISWLVSLTPSQQPTRLPKPKKKKRGRKKASADAVQESASAHASVAPSVVSASSLRHIFTDQFVDAVDAAAVRYASPMYYRALPDDAIDANDHAAVAPRNFLPSFFTHMSAALGANAASTALLITSVRSDSHEPGPVWQCDVEQNLALLQPGGVLITDGHRESYSRIYRTLPALPAGYRAWWTMDRDSGHPLSFVVQRQHPTEPYLDEHYALRERLLAGDAVLADPDAVLGLRPDLCIANNVRMEVGQILTSRQEFIGLQQFIEDEVRQRLLRALCRQMIADMDPERKPDVLTMIVETVQRHISALVTRAVDREMARRTVHGSTPSRPAVLREIQQYFGVPENVSIPRKAKPEDVLDQSFKKLRSWMFGVFGATQKKGHQHQLQVKEHYSEGMLHGMIAAVIAHAPEHPQINERVLWNMARNLDMRATPCIEDIDDLVTDVTKDIVERIEKMVHARRKLLG